MIEPPTERPRVLVAVVGTATEVGKTWTSARVLTGLADRGHTVAARKPAQSFDPASSEPTDATVLAAATGEHVDDVCPAHRSYPVAMAPPMAADILGRPSPRLADLVAEISWPAGVDIGLVESVGGVRSPVADDGDSRDLVDALSPDIVLLVADAGLGVIDAVRSVVDALDGHRCVVFLNRFDHDDDLHRRNRAWLSDRDGYDIAVDLEVVREALIDSP